MIEQNNFCAKILYSVFETNTTLRERKFMASSYFVALIFEDLSFDLEFTYMIVNFERFSCVSVILWVMMRQHSKDDS